MSDSQLWAQPTPAPDPASPRLSFDLSEVAHADCHKDACVEVPCHLETGVVGLWSTGGKAGEHERKWGTTGSLSLNSGYPKWFLSLEQ